MSEHNDQKNLASKETETKYTIRENVWSELWAKKQCAFPFPPFGRIPNFIGSKDTPKKLLEIPEFITANSVEVNPDKPLGACRSLVLQQGKQLYVPVPQLRDNLLKKLEKSDKYSIQETVTRWGIEHLGKNISLDDKIYIDLLIVGSVAVSKDGHRIGKGKGFADLEFALLKEMKAIDDNTVIITVVHDLQVFDTLPSDLFQMYDVPVDIIVTPTQIIRVENKLPRPSGIYWNMLTPKKVQSIESLKKLKEKLESEGVEVILNTENKKDDEKPGNRFPRRRFTRTWKNKPQRKSSGNTDKSTNDSSNSAENSKQDEQKPKHEINENHDENESKGAQNRYRKSHRKTYYRKPDENKQKGKENRENVSPKMKKRKKVTEGYSLCVSNIERTVRVRDLKSALQEKGIRPNFIVWKGFRGFCYLHYSTKKIKKKESDNEESFAIDNLIEKIQGIKINPTEDRNLDVAVMDPITRIETVNVSSV